MDRNREARRATMAAANGLPRRRQRSSGLRDSPEEDGAMELVETSRLRDRKKDRDRDRDRERERDRERDRISRSKRRRGLGVVGGGGGGGDRDESSEESVNDEEDDDDEDAAAGGSMRMGPASAAVSMSPSATSMMNHHGHHHNHHNHHHHPQQQQQQHHSHNNHHGGGNLNNHSHNNVGSHHHQLQQLQHQRKSFPPPSKNFRAPQTAALKAADEMIGVSVPRKARSASTKRSNEWTSSAVGMVASDQIHRQESTSPLRPAATVAGQASTPLAPVSPPSSSNASVRKKLKPNNGPKLRQPKPPPPSSKSSSSAQDEIEIEIAEVLYGMMRQPQGPSKQEIATNDSKEVSKSAGEANKSSSEAKSRVSSPISSSPYGAPQSLPSRSSHPVAGAESSVPAWPFTVAVPKRKKPRLVKYDGKYEESKPSYIPSNPISSAAKIPTDQFAKTEPSSANLEKPAGSTPENGGIASDTAQSRPPPPSLESHQPESVKLENSLVSDSKPGADKSESRDLGLSKEELDSPKKESAGQRLDDKREIATSMKLNSTTSEIESQREEKFQIDLMAPPPSRSSPERDVEIDYVATEAKPMAIDTETEIKPVIKEDTKALKLVGGEQQQQQQAEQPLNAEPEKAKSGVVAPTVVEDPEPKKLPGVKERNIDLHLDLDHSDVARDSSTANKPHHHHHHHHVLPRQYQQPHPPSTIVNDKSAQSGPPLPLPNMPMPTWPGGLSPMGYMTPLQGVVSVDASAVSSAAIQPPPHPLYIFNLARSKRCATHCDIARSISMHQQYARMSYWPAAAGSGPVYGAKPCNLNIMPNPVDLHGNMPAVHRGVNPVQDKVPGLAMFPGHNGKDKASPAMAGVVDSAQRKQILLQPPLPPGAPSDLVQGQAIIFPLSQQQAVAAAAAVSVRPPGAVKSPVGPGNATVPNGANPTASAVGAQAMTFNYPSMAGNEQPQYLAINAYSFPIPAHVGPPPAYRGAHPPAMPYYNGSYYSTFHPSQLPQQQQPNLSQQQAQQHGHQNPSMSSGSSSSQKHLQSQQQQQQQQRQSQHVNNAMNGAGGGGSLHGFPASKNPSAQAQQQIQMQQQRQHQSQHHIAHQARQLESEMGNEESPSTADSRMTRPTMSMYSANYAMPIHGPNFAMMTPASLAAPGGGGGGGGGNSEKKHQQQQGSKGGSIEPQAFAMSFASMNGAPNAPPGLDIASLAQQQAMFPDMRGYQQYVAVTAATAQAVAQQKKNYRGPEDGKTGGDTSNTDEERKAAMKSSSGVPHSIAFSRPDLSDASGSAMPGTTVVDSSARNLNLASAQQRSSGSVALPPGMTNVNAASAQQQRNLQHQHQHQHQQQQQQMIQLQKQHQQLVAAASRTKTPPTSNGSIYSDHLPSSMAAKFPNALSTFPQSLVHGTTTSPAQSTQWKSSARSSASQVPSPSMTASSNPSSLKNLPQQQGRSQQTHTQISFAAAGNQKPSVVVQSQVPASSNQSPSPPIMVGSPTTSSVSKSAGGSPRTTTTSTSTGNKGPQASSLSSQQSKNSQPVPTMKSSPVVPGKNNINGPSILGNPHISSSVNTAGGGAKSQLPQQQPVSKQSVQQAQLYFSPAYLPTQAPHSNSASAATAAAAAAASGPYYSQRRRSDQPQQQPQGVVAGPGSTGMLSLSPSVTVSNTGTSDSSKTKGGGGLPSQALMHTQFAAAVQSGNVHQIMPAGFSYVHSVPTAVQVKPAEQKQPAGE